MTPEPLPAIEHGHGAERAVFLHGFGGRATTWDAVQNQLDLPSIAFDLPGHGRALPRQDMCVFGGRNAVMAEVERRGIEKVHLVGHSRGGAIAVLVAFKMPERIASLTFCAPGGFGEEIAADELGAFAEAASEAEVRAALEALCHPSAPSEDLVAETVAHRRDERVMAALEVIREGLTTNGKQGVLRLDWLTDAPFPIAIFWGDQDRVLPVSQARAIPTANLHILPGIGHDLPTDAAAEIAEAVRRTFASTET